MSHWQPKLLIQTVPDILPLTITRESEDSVEIVTDINSNNFIIYSSDDSNYLPRFIYERDEVTGEVSTYLAVEEDDSFNTDVDYTDRQQWLLNQRQGDQYDRIRERIPRTELADLESNNDSSINLLNEDMIWHGINLPIDITTVSNYDKIIQNSIDRLEE